MSMCSYFSVTELLLNECELADISVEEGDFPSLESLAIRNNNIQDVRIIHSSPLSLHAVSNCLLY